MKVVCKRQASVEKINTEFQKQIQEEHVRVYFSLHVMGGRSLSAVSATTMVFTAGRAWSKRMPTTWIRRGEAMEAGSIFVEMVDPVQQI